MFLLNTDVHAGWVNSKALELAGMTASTPDPWDGYLVRDADGSPTGTLQEGAAYDVMRTVVAQPSVAQWQTYLLRAQQELHALGITGWQDAWVEPDLLRAYRELDDEGALTARVVASMGGIATPAWSRSTGSSSSGSGRAEVGSTRTRSRSCSTAARRAAPARCSSRTRATSAGGTIAASSSSRPRR